MGRNRKSEAEKALEGNPGKKKKGIDPKIEPIVDDSPPRGMDKGQRKYWNLYAPYLVKNGLLTNLNITDLRRLCFYEAEAVEIQEGIASGKLSRWQEKVNYHGEVVGLGDSAPAKTLKDNTAIIRQLKADLRIRTDKLPIQIKPKQQSKFDGLIGVKGGKD